MSNPLTRLHDFGQSVWLDYIHRRMLEPGGELQQLIDRDGLRGVTSNPSIFEKAIGGGPDYDGTIARHAPQAKTASEIFEAIAVEDVGHAADLFRPLYESSQGGDGFVSIEVSPAAAHNTPNTLTEARRLWSTLRRPNVMIKVPGTREGLPAIQQLIREGVNVNVTLLFGVPRYGEVLDAYLAGLEQRQAEGQPIARVASVASFFLSRIDTLLDPQLEKLALAGGTKGELAGQLAGHAAIDSARIAYRHYQTILDTPRWRRLAAAGACPQRLLWASTSTKNPKYPDVMYVEALIGPDTVNTLPMETLEAYRDHGQPAPRLQTEVDASQRRLGQLAEVGIDLPAATVRLEQEGVQKFAEAYDKLIRTLETKREALLNQVA